MLTDFKNSYFKLSKLASLSISLILLIEFSGIYLYLTESITEKFLFLRLFSILTLLFLWLTFSYVLEKRNKKIIKNTELNIADLKYQKEILKIGLSLEMQNTLNRWNLTKSEVEICHLLLKGFSLEQISVFRGISLATTKEHCKNIYRKGEVKNRIELMSYFLEDFLIIDT
jgi:DNA-binding CsgD family transcriptional regulator